MNPYMKKYEKEIMEIIETCHRESRNRLWSGSQRQCFLSCG